MKERKIKARMAEIEKELDAIALWPKVQKEAAQSEVMPLDQKLDELSEKRVSLRKICLVTVSVTVAIGIGAWAISW